MDSSANPAPYGIEYQRKSGRIKKCSRLSSVANGLQFGTQSCIVYAGDFGSASKARPQPIGQFAAWGTEMDGFISIKAPTGPAGVISAAQIVSGPPILPVARIKLYSASDWEEFTNEWAHCALKKNYHDVVRFGSSGDRGVDIAVFFDKDGFLGAWDGFQCKHYAKPLAPADAKPEIAKLLWYSFKGEYKPPTSYSFVAPCGIGTKLNNLLKNATALKKDVIDTWDKVCRSAITDTQEVPLEGDFLTFVENFDFSIFHGKQPLTIIEEHSASPHHLSRFGGGLPARPVSILHQPKSTPWKADMWSNC